jgi:hypothetical protein
MVVLAIVLPLLIGIGGYFLLDVQDRPRGWRGQLIQVLRGYPYGAVLATTLLVLLFAAPIRKVRDMARRWEDAHVPMFVKPGGYDRVAADLEAAIDSAGVDVERGRAPWVLEAPSKLLALVGGPSVRALVPDQLVVLHSRSLEITIHPTDVAISGEKELVARGRAAIASRLAFTAAHLTTAREAQGIEDSLREIASLPPERGLEELRHVDRRIASLVIGEEEWEVLYRTRLQVERDLLREVVPVARRHGPVSRLVRAWNALVGHGLGGRRAS